MFSSFGEKMRSQCFGEKMHFPGFSRKHVFRVSVEKCVFQILLGKCIFRLSEENTFSGVLMGISVFPVLVRIHVFLVLTGNKFSGFQ